VFDRFGVNVEEQSDNWILHPSDNMHVESFPFLPPTGLTITFDRAVALTREDFTFITWDHPMVHAAMDMILNEGYGQADCRVVSLDVIPKGLAFVEAIFTIGCTADHRLNVDRYIQASLQTYYVGIDKKDYTDIIEQVDLDSASQRYDRNKLKGVVQKLVGDARELIETEFSEERERLVALQRVNPTVRDEEIKQMDERRDALLAALNSAQARPVSVRVLFNN